MVINNPLVQTFPVRLVVTEFTHIMNVVDPSCSSKAKLFGSKYIGPEPICDIIPLKFLPQRK